MSTETRTVSETERRLAGAADRAWGRAVGEEALPGTTFTIRGSSLTRRQKLELRLAALLGTTPRRRAAYRKVRDDAPEFRRREESTPAGPRPGPVPRVLPGERPGARTDRR